MPCAGEGVHQNADFSRENLILALSYKKERINPAFCVHLSHQTKAFSHQNWDSIRNVDWPVECGEMTNRIC